MRLHKYKNYYNLARPKLRPTWNKYNLYNITKYETQKATLARQTFFQQKWMAKAITRTYHGETLGEKKWERMFSRRLNAVVPMKMDYMARHDGSEMAAGRGSGLDGVERDAAHTNVDSTEATPYMSMTFAPLERRLDTAVFRALFASSLSQARQFVVHGGVKVNGQSMNQPGYLLHPGDMFSVDPELVLYATGRPKTKPKASTSEAKAADGVEATEEVVEEEAASKGSAEAAEGETTPQLSKRAKKRAENEALAAEEAEQRMTPEAIVRRLKMTNTYVKQLLAKSKDELRVRHKREIRALARRARSQLARATSALKQIDPSAADVDLLNTSELDNSVVLMERINEAISLLTLSTAKPAELQQLDAQAAADVQKDAAQEATTTIITSENSDDPTSLSDSSSPSSTSTSNSRNPKHIPTDDELTPEEAKRFQELLREEEENPTDPSKPYRTPWEPREYMPAFAFIPRYLEVNQNVCSAVYLRHPVARPGFSEVPSPFPPHVMQLAFNWYLRRW